MYVLFTVTFVTHLIEMGVRLIYSKCILNNIMYKIRIVISQKLNWNFKIVICNYIYILTPDEISDEVSAVTDALNIDNSD